MIDPYEVEIKVRNNRLLSALRHAFPFAKTRREWAKLCDVDQTQMSSYICMRIHPLGRCGWNKDAIKISDATGELPEYLFDPEIYPIIKGRILKTIESGDIRRRLPPLQPVKDPAEIVHELEIHSLLEKNLKTIRPRNRQAIEMYYGIGGDDAEMVYQEVGKKMGVTKDRAHQLEHHGIRQLRHPTKMGKYRDEL